MKIYTKLLCVCLPLFFCGEVMAQTIKASDNASNYTAATFTNKENLGSGFSNWYVNANGGANLLGPAAVQGENSAPIDTENRSFALSTEETGSSDLGRLFTGTLQDGEAFSFELAYHWDAATKGFSVHNGGWTESEEMFFWRVEPAGQFWSGGGEAAPSAWDGQREFGASMKFTFTQNGNNLDYTFEGISGAEPSGSGTIENVTIDRVRFWGTDTYNWDSEGSGNLYFNSMMIASGDATSKEEETIIPDKFELTQNYPNPFNPVTNIQYSLSQGSEVRLAVYDLLGRELSVLVDAFKAPGNYTVQWEALNFPSGMYIYKLSSEGQTLVKKMTLMK